MKNSNLAIQYQDATHAFTPLWQVAFTAIDLIRINELKVPGKSVEGESRLRLITRSGFEQKHIVTSQIASM